MLGFRKKKPKSETPVDSTEIRKELEEVSKRSKENRERLRALNEKIEALSKEVLDGVKRKNAL